MRKGLLLGCVFLGVAGCGPSADDLVKESLKCWHEAATVLEAVEDAEGVKTADVKLRTIVERMSELNAQARRITSSPEEMGKVERDNQEATAAVLGRVREAGKKVSGLPGGAEVVYRFNRRAMSGR